MRMLENMISRFSSSSKVVWFLADQGERGKMSLAIWLSADYHTTPSLTTCGSGAVSVASTHRPRFLLTNSALILESFPIRSHRELLYLHMHFDKKTFGKNWRVF